LKVWNLPRLLARLDALASEPVTSLARSLDVVTVSEGRACLISDWTTGMAEELLAAT
jgi:hypothetical protein